MKINTKIINVKNAKEAVLELSNDELVLENTYDLVERPEKITGSTYKLKSPLLDSSMYVTINNVEEDGIIFPFEIFIHSKEVIYQQWIHITARLISAIFRMAYTYKVDSSFIISELKAIHSATGSYFKKGKVVTSVVSEIGDIIEDHLQSIGYVKAKAALPEYVKEKAKQVEKNPEMAKNLIQCGVCGSRSVVRQDGCSTCLDCGHSKCG